MFFFSLSGLKWWWMSWIRGAIHLQTSICVLHRFSFEAKQQLRKPAWDLMLDGQVHSSAKSHLLEAVHCGFSYIRTAGSTGEQEGGVLRGPGEWHLAWLAASLSLCCPPQTRESLSHRLMQVDQNSQREEGLWCHCKWRGKWGNSFFCSKFAMLL